MIWVWINTYYLFIPFLGEWTSINPSYFDVNYRGTIGFDTLPSWGENRFLWMEIVPTCRLCPPLKKHGANPHDFWPHLRETVLDTRKPITPNGHSFQVPLGHMMYTPFKLSSSELLKGNLVIKLYFDSSNAGFWIFRDSRITCSKAWFVTSGGYIFSWVACIAKHK